MDIQETMKRAALLLLLSFLCIKPFATEASLQLRATSSFAVLHYDAEVDPDIANKTVKGRVLIRLISRTAELLNIELDCGELIIDSVRENREALKFAQNDHRLNISLSRPAKANETREIAVEYHGAPRRGIRFFPEQKQVYTVFATSQWMVCVDAPDDRATLNLKLSAAPNLKTIANGSLARQTRRGDKIIYEWRQQKRVPTYTFGFAVGPFHVLTETSDHAQLNYLSTRFTDDELRRIFRDAADMVNFYEARAGVPYPDTAYTQVLAAGGVEQEMSGFTVMRESYDRDVLKNERDVWLGAHELAHQWWGNMVRCFSLNEGMATFMADAYKEHRFGRAEYLREIETFRGNYEKVRDAGKDKSLVFPDWSHPTAEDRTLVYHKGAYVLYLLREELGEQSFWAGIRLYTRRYFGQSVTTPDFQAAMEQASGKNLTEFFAKWVYLTQR